MVEVCGPAEYKCVARVRVHHGELPSDREIRLDRTSPIQACPGAGRGRQVEEFDLIGMVLHPGGDPVRPMDRQIVDDHEQLARGLADQAL